MEDPVRDKRKTAWYRAINVAIIFISFFLGITIANGDGFYLFVNPIMTILYMAPFYLVLRGALDYIATGKLIGR